MNEEQMEQADSSDDCEIIDSIDIIKQEPLGSPEPAKDSDNEDVMIIGETNCFNFGTVKKENEDNSTNETQMISFEPQTDEPPPNIDIKMEKSCIIEPSETLPVLEVPKESATNLENQETEPTTPTVEKDVVQAPEPETVPKIQAIPVLKTTVRIKQEPKEKTPPPLPSTEVNFGASTSHSLPPPIIKPSPPSSPPPESPTTIKKMLKVEPLKIDPGNVGVIPHFINLDDFTMDNKRKRGYCDPLGEFIQTFFIIKYL